MRKGSRYEAPSEEDTLNDLSKKLAGDLRTHVRRLEPAATFSKPWLQMIDSIQHIASIAQMEHRLPREGDATLWENDELTVRFLLEEGKLNLCLRQINAYTTVLSQCADTPAKRSAWLTRTARELGMESDAALQSKLNAYETSLGVLLRCAFQHVEAVQTTDLPLLFEHAAQVLSATPEAMETRRNYESGTFERMQPALVLRYLASVLERIEILGEGRIMPNVRERRLIELTIRHLHGYHAQLTEEDRLAGCAFFATAIDTDDFEGAKSAFLPAESAQLLKAFPQAFLTAMTADHAIRKKLRPLLDTVQRG